MPTVLLSDGSQLPNTSSSTGNGAPDKIASSVVNALIAIEDQRFFQPWHRLRRTAGACSTPAGDRRRFDDATATRAQPLSDEIGRFNEHYARSRKPPLRLKIEAVYTTSRFD
jgi:hypothetical protein